MKKRGMKVTKYILLLGIMLSSAPLFPAQESASSVAQKEEQSRLARIYNWLFEKYGMPGRDWDILKGWLIKKWRREEIEPALDKQAKSIFKKYIIPAVVIAALAAGTGVWWWRKKGIEQRAQIEKEEQAWLEKHPLIRAVKEQKIGEVRKLLEGGADINSQDKKGNTPLMLAAQNRDTPMLYLLLGYNPDTSKQNKKGETVFNIFPGIKNIIARTKLYRAKAVVSPIPAEEGEPSPLADVPPELRKHIASFILEEDYLTKINQDLINAAQRGDINTANELLQMGADVNYVSEPGNTPLGVAAMTGKENMITFLLDNQADIDAYSKGMTPLMWAAARGSRAVVDLLLNRGAAIDAQSTIGKTALMYAVEKGYPEVVELLLEKVNYPLDLSLQDAIIQMGDPLILFKLQSAQFRAHQKERTESQEKHREELKKILIQKRTELEEKYGEKLRKILEPEGQQEERKAPEAKEHEESIERAKQTLTPEQRTFRTAYTIRTDSSRERTNRSLHCSEKERKT